MDTRKFVRACVACQLSKKSRSKKAGLLKSITASEPWEIIGIDFIGPIRDSKKGNRHILVITDYFTKWPEAYALKEATSREVARILVTKIFPRHGLPKKILSDQGSQFTSHLLNELLEEMKIKKMQTTAYHPQCDGQVERLNSVLKTQITIFCDQRQSDWDEWLPLVLLAYRRTKHSATGYSPYFMLHGREPLIAMDTIISAKMKETVSNHQYINDLISALKTAHEAAKIATLKAKEEQQRQYNKDKLNVEYEVDDYVIVQAIKKPGDFKFKRPFYGPFRIRQKLSELNYKLEDLEGNPIEKTFNITQLKRINFNNVSEWNEQADSVEKYQIDEEEPSSDEDEEETRLNDRRENNNDEDEDNSSDNSDSESESLDRVDQKEKQKIEKEKEKKKKKLEKFHDEIKGIHAIIAGKEIKKLSAIKTQLSRDIIPLHVKNSTRKENFIACVKKCENTKQLEDLLKNWIDEFANVFEYELTSATK